MARLNKWWRVGLPCCRSKMRASSRRLRVPGLSRARPNHLITRKSNGLETWFPHVSHCFPIRMTIWCSEWGYTRCSNIPRVAIQVSKDRISGTCIQCKSSLICFNIPWYSMLNIIHPQAIHSNDDNSVPSQNHRSPSPRFRRIVSPENSIFGFEETGYPSMFTKKLSKWACMGKIWSNPNNWMLI